MNVSIVASVALLALGLSLLVATIWDRRSRRAFIREGPVFAARFRCAGPSPRCWRGLRRGWSRKMWAYWRDDVLVIRRGWVFDRRLRMFAQITLAGVYGLSGQRGAIAVHLRLPDGALLEVTAPSGDRVELVGPYLAAGISHLPRAPLRRRDRRRRS
ncbi:hypothetical protein Q0Z83_030620 [Actinoplanes sichuanensis]|uniref:DUF2550 family protein n=1 Tax=Actinoplanes sichuanensis TaxID=512349 RepID=A0ABW4ARN0_9ACTN|nr:hypothetical protein [Actinoplanes sichuanensis]BEL04871.1 hypothetical protein Q0Z83_030620 [Actinoplanes sichuanensis]